MSLRFGQVVHVYPNYFTCEIVMCDTGQRYQNVTILSPFVSNNSGVRYQHGVIRPESEELAGGLMTNDEDRTVLAACVFVGGKPMVVGFIAHPLTQLAWLPEEQNRDTYRHPAGVLVNTERHGNHEIHHTGGCFIKIGKDATNAAGVEVLADRHEDLTPICANENWIYPINDPVTITICTGDQGAEAFKMRVRPNGDTDIYSSGNLVIDYLENCTVNIGGDTLVNTLGTTTVNSQGDCKVRSMGDVVVTAAGAGRLHAAGEASLFAGGTATVAAAGDATVAAVGTVNVASEGPLTVASATTITLGAPEITALTELFIVTGEIIALGEFGGGALGAALATGIVASAVPPLAAMVPVELAEAEAQLAQAMIDIELAVAEAVETSLEAVGTGPADNEGLGGDPAPDVP
jgi:hypothetical protein